MEPNKYNNSCIYKISKHNFIYIGSTCNFKRRMIEHKSSCNNIKSKKRHLKIYQTIRLHGGWDSFEKVVIKNICCENRKELHEIEAKFIKNIGTMNCQNAGRNKKQKMLKEKQKILKEKILKQKILKEKILENQKILKEKILEKQNLITKTISEKQKQYKIKKLEQKKQYRENNKDILSKKAKQYRKKNKDKLKEKRKIYYEAKTKKIIICPFCDILVSQYNLKRHQQGKKCMKFQ